MIIIIIIIIITMLDMLSTRVPEHGSGSEHNIESNIINCPKAGHI